MVAYDSNLPLTLIEYVLEDVVARVDVNEYPMLMALDKEYTGQRRIEWPIEVGGAAANVRKAGDTVSVNTGSTAVKAYLEVGEQIIDHTFSLRTDEYAEALLRGKLAINNLFTIKVNEAVLAIMRKLGTLVYTGTGIDADAGIFGLDNIVTATSYANVTSATYANWIGYLNTNSSDRKLTRSLLSKVDSEMGKKGGRYNVIFAPKEVEECFKAIYQNLGLTQLAPQNRIAMLGMEAAAYGSKIVVPDINCPAKSMYFVNTNYTKLKFFDYRIAMDALLGERMRVVEKMGIPFVITNVTSPASPELLSYNVKVEPQLVCTHRHYTAKLAKLIDDVEQYFVDPEPVAAT